MQGVRAVAGEEALSEAEAHEQAMVKVTNSDPTLAEQTSKPAAVRAAAGKMHCRRLMPPSQLLSEPSTLAPKAAKLYGPTLLTAVQK